jgi:DNA-binding NtrC family response regulator
MMNLLVVGGDLAERMHVVEAFHRESPFRFGPLIRVDCARHESALVSALRARLAGVPDEIATSPLRAAEHGTMFLDSLVHLSPEAQKLLLAFARDLGDSADSHPRWIGRLAAGSPGIPEVAVAERRLSEALLDCLDKIRIDLATLTSGVA